MKYNGSTTDMINYYKSNNKFSWKVCVNYKFVGYVTVPFYIVYCGIYDNMKWGRNPYHLEKLLLVLQPPCILFLIAFPCLESKINLLQAFVN